MQEVVSILRYHTVSVDLEASTARLAETRRIADATGGLIGISLYQSTTDPSGMLGIAQFTSEEALLESWDQMARSDLLHRMQDTMSDTPNWQRFRIEHNAGVKIGQFPLGTLASISVRTAMPGHGRDLVDDLKDVFVVLGALPGYLGGMGGRLSDLESEVIGLVFWDNEDAFQRSLPAKTMYKIDLFRKIL
ncbi:MAG: hypothetical protein AB7F50_11715 [Fimbriimonadaceae bacterium]